MANEFSPHFLMLNLFQHAMCLLLGCKPSPQGLNHANSIMPDAW